MKISICENCANFHQHYTYSKFGFSKIECGHCSKKKMKKKECNFFEENKNNFTTEINIMQLINDCNKQIKFMIKKLNNIINSTQQIKEQTKVILKKR